MTRGDLPKAMNRGAHRSMCAISVAIAAAMPAAAVAKTETGADVALTAAIASNPFQANLSSSESGSASVSLSPWITFIEAETSLKLSGDLRVTEYEKSFPRSDSYRVGADGTWKINPRLTLASSVSYSESTVGETGLVENFSPGVILIEDPALIGIRTRRRAFDASATAQFRPDAKQSWTFSANAIDSRFTNLTAGNDYALYGGTIAYDRITRRGTFGASLGLQRYECRSFQSCSQVLVSPQLTASLRLNALWTLKGAAGLSYAKLRQPVLNTETWTPSVNATLCRKNARSNLCLSAAHTVEATALGASRPVLSANISGDYKLTERNSISLSGFYAGSTQSGSTLGTGPAVASDFRYFGIRLSDEHRIRRNMYLVVTGSQTITDSSFLNRRTNSEVSIGVRFSFGSAS
jgi:hypothetical protein